MSFIGAIKSFLGVSEAKTEELKKETQTRTATDPATGKIGQLLTTGQVSQSEAHSGKNGQSTNTGTGDKYIATPAKDIDLDTKKKAKEYKKNPLEALNDATVGRKYNADEAAELKELIKDKDDLQNYFELAKKGALSNSDIVAGLKELAANKTSYLWGLFKGNKLNEEKFASNMDRVRKLRKEFSSDGSAQISKFITKNEEFTDTTVHLLAKRDVYSEKNVIDGVSYLEQNPKKGIEFFNNLTELEGIRNEKGEIKYKGDTIIQSTRAMTSNKEIREPILTIAKRKGMDENTFSTISSRIENTPEMAPAMQEFAQTKDAKGEYRFNNNCLNTQSAFMNGKKAEEIELYRDNTVQLAGYQKLSGEQVVSCAGNVTTYPKTREQVMSAAANPSVSGDQVTSLSHSLTNPEEASNRPHSSNADTRTATSQNYSAIEETAQKSGVSTPIGNSETVVQDRAISLLQQSNIKTNNIFGTQKDYDFVAEQVKKNPELKSAIQKLYNNPNISANKIPKILKECSNSREVEIYASDPVYFEKNPSMLKLYAKNKDFFDKLGIYGLTTSQKEQLSGFATGSTRELLFEMLDSGISPDKIATYITAAKQGNKEDSLTQLMTDNTLNATERLEKLKNKEFAKA